MSQVELVPLAVRIMGRDYQVSCPSDEKEALLASARYLDERMQAIRKRSAGLGVERIAVMTALNMARELMDSGKASGKRRAADDGDADERIHQLQLRIDAELQQD